MSNHKDPLGAATGGGAPPYPVNYSKPDPKVVRNKLRTTILDELVPKKDKS